MIASPHKKPNVDRLSDIANHIDRAAHLLPAQGPISVFIHHNTLHAFEEKPFLEAVVDGMKTFGCQPFLSEDEYREAFRNGRIRLEDIEAALIEDLGVRDDELIDFLGTRFELRCAMLRHPIRSAPSAELRWLVAETDALRTFRPEAKRDDQSRMVQLTKRWILRDFVDGTTSAKSRLSPIIYQLIGRFSRSLPTHWSESMWSSFCLHLLWQACRQGVHGVARSPDSRSPLLRHRDLLREATGEDSDVIVNDILIRFCQAFLDQGMAHWALPNIEKGFYRSFIELYASAWLPPHRLLRRLAAELRRLRHEQLDPIQSIADSFDRLGVEAHELQSYISESLLALRGWAGMIHQVETRGDRVAKPAPAGTLTEFLAIRLLLDRLIVEQLAKEAWAYTGELSELRSVIRHRLTKRGSVNVEARAITIFQLAQFRGWSPEFLFHMSAGQWSRLVYEMESFSGVDRRKVFQLAFERRYRHQVLDALAVHTDRVWLPLQKASSNRTDSDCVRARFQLICCIDDREESLRRHVEELEPECETLGAAGFFAAPMYFRGVGDANFIPLCPIVMKPRHYVTEEVKEDFLGDHLRKSKVRQTVGLQIHAVHRVSRTILGSALIAVAGSLATIPLVARVLFPRLTARFRRLVGGIIRSPDSTELTLRRTAESPGTDLEGRGFSLDEMTSCVERLLRDTGLTTKLSRLVIIAGHGSASLNNPHESAYNCGACGGGRGGPNARIICTMANDPVVRRKLTDRGIHIPEDTHFLGAFHNTCDDTLAFFDLDAVPPEHVDELNKVRRVLDLACRRNAHERCRRFTTAELTMDSAATLRHVEARGEDLSQTRPEYNHATNAVCFVGRRSRTRGLFLDRRSFLVSYDPRQDSDDQAILLGILQAVVPVCAGINLEYYFSSVDVSGYGCGTKLPHNVTSLLGVMDGAASDLRTGLSAQMTEIHEPVRLLFVIETNPEAFLSIMERDPAIARLCRNGWVQVAILDPESSCVQLLKDSRFVRHQVETMELPEVKSSLDWYRGWRDNLGFSLVQDGMMTCKPER